MSQTKKSSFVLLGLTVLLLFIVSVRMGQDGILAGETTQQPEQPDIQSPIQTVAPMEETLPEETGPVLLEIDLSSWEYKLVNDTYSLSSSFAPNVTEIGNQQYFDSRATDALNALLQGAADAGYSTCVRTGYCPYSTQAYIFYGKASQLSWDDSMSYEDAEVEARNYVAYPGTSEHQLGLAVDIMDSADTIMIAEDVAELPVLVWLQEHCAEYGFILRYPADKKEVTGWYEPWHFRYVGKEAASYIMENNLCLEEFLALY